MDFKAKEMGIKAENYFCSLLNKIGLKYKYVDDWYDFNVNGYKIEVKSCQLTVKNGIKLGSTIGRFNFTKKENRDKQLKENIWICLIVRYRTQFILLGFLEANQLKNKRYLSIHEANELSPIDFEDWLIKIYTPCDIEENKK